MTGVRPVPTRILHFTHVGHLASIVENGLLSDSLAQETGALSIEVGNTTIKAQRRATSVPIGPGGVVSDYVPFYFAERSPMMYAIHRGNVPTYQEGCGDLVYLVSTVERLLEFRLDVVFTDRNAALGYAGYSSELAELGEMVDWDLMKAKMWNNTAENPDRRERRMAECLAHRTVPWDAFLGVVARGPVVAARAKDALDEAGSLTPVDVRSDWYF